MAGYASVDRSPRTHGEMECDEVDVIAGHKEKPETIHGPQARRSRPKSAHGRATLEKEKPPIFGMIERNGHVRIEMLAMARSR